MYLISIVLAVLAVIGQFTAIPIFTAHGFWLLAVGYGLLAISVLFRGN
jgi:uncharacterized membrane protein